MSEEIYFMPPINEEIYERILPSFDLKKERLTLREFIIRNDCFNGLNVKGESIWTS